MKWIIRMLAGIMIVAIILTGCNGIKQGETLPKDGDPPNTIIDEEAATKRFSPEELKLKLQETTGIELKDTDNQAVGMLADREVILAFIEELFAYPMQQEYPQEETDQNQVVGPLNFYFSNTDDLYGLVKEDYIYVEGYYFLLQRGNLDKIQTLFSGHTIKAPVGSDS